MAEPVETKQDVKVDQAWNRLTHTMFRKMPAYLTQVANARRSVNAMFQGRR
jgi:hypothetical protein